ncbi:tetratricopeptide repeat protein [Lentzea sp. JNUCC 0626]|uniref:tetratricopeptide repeat protein n=1 Tax=Lentzea sp. JNUCC 0626 TaxID=3367513 RepID=UPI003749EEE4
MSTFALNPPADVQVVSFFITGRLNGQNDQTAFLDNVLEQLLSLLHQDVPELLTEATKHAHLLRLLDAAAAQCHSRSESLVLVVDGLDEDAGGHSIASLLPARLPEGMRIVVAGRPNPPADVPDDHPLRCGTAEIRTLTPSPQAVAVRREAERELKSLLHGPARDLLGLICAAGGGLTAADLAELTATSSFEIEEHLHTAAGRSFSRRDELYLLAHEELRVTALRMFGPRLADHRERLHAWADGYHDQGWPESTPDYLLHGYAAMLRSLTDTTRLVSLVIDRERAARLRHRTGGDAAAYSEILSAQQLVLDHTPADLLSTVKLASARGVLGAHNGHLPVKLPTVWEVLGEPQRAAALAHGIVNERTRSEALAMLAKTTAEAGDLARAEETADSVSDLSYRAQAFTDLTLIAASAGDHQHADLLLTRARAAADQIDDARASIHLARAAHSLGHRDQASALLDSGELPDRDDLSLVTVELVACAEAVGDSRRAARIIWAIPDKYEQVILLCALADEAFRQGRTERATTVLDIAEVLALQVDNQVERVCALSKVCQTANSRDRSTAVADAAFAEARFVDDEFEDTPTLAALVDCALACGDLQRAESNARMITRPSETAEELVKVAGLALEMGDRSRGETLAAELMTSHAPKDTLAELALRVAQLGEHPLARKLAERSEAISRNGPTPYFDHVAADLTSALCSLGWYEEAETVAHTVVSPDASAEILTTVLSSVGPTGDRDRVFRLADAIEVALSRLTVEHVHERASQAYLTAVTAAAEFSRATTIIDAYPRGRARAIAIAIAAVAAAPIDLQLAIRFAERAEADVHQLSRTGHYMPYSDIAIAYDVVGLTDRAMEIADRQGDRDPALRTMATNAARKGELDQARRLLELITDRYTHQSALADVAAAAAMAGSIKEAEFLAAQIEAEYRRDEPATGLAIAVAKAGEFSRARQYADMVKDKDHRFVLLGDVAMVAADAGENTMARQLLQEVLTTADRWSRGLKALGKLEPDTLRAFYRLYREAQG